jgi:phenylacetate-CoA ligase
MNENRLSLLRDVYRAGREGPVAMALRQRERLADMVAYARAHSPFFRERYRKLPERVEESARLPVTSKQELMARFDDWVTDRNVTIEQAQAFVNNPDLIGERFLGRYKLATTSGTTGTHGVFVLDGRSLNVAKALSSRTLGAWFDRGDVARIVARGGKLAMLFATGGHFASAVASANLQNENWLRRKVVQVFPVRTAIPELVTQLNAFDPAVITSYASTMALLTGEQEAGRLHIHPVLVTTTAEGLPVEDYERMANAFGTKVRNIYACTEVPFFSVGCEYHWFHVNTDWVVFEPVDEHYQPTPKGEPSHTVLISNLANRVQPILRYDLGDRVLQRPDPCECGNPLPAIRVQGRSADVLTFPGAHGAAVKLTSPTFGTVVDRTPGVELFQIVQATPTELAVRLRYADGANPDRVWQSVRTEIETLLTENSLGHVVIKRAKEPPEQSAGGKYRMVIPLR